MRFLIRVVATGVTVIMSQNVNSSPNLDLPKNEIRARQPFKYPIDPLMVTSMSDYDLSLILFRTWFDYDDGRMAKPDLISSWKFDSASGAYEFTIASDAKWSDGNSVTPDDLKRNLLRAVANNTTYGHGIAESIDLSSFKITSDQTFSLRTKDGKTSESFFQRLGSIFLAVAPPVDFSSDARRMKSNLVSGGPFIMSKQSADELDFVRNQAYSSGNQKRAVSIKIRKPDAKFDLMNFLDQKSWENYVQLTTIIPEEAAKKLIKSGLPHWTRGHDRVSVLSPLGTGEGLAEKREILELLGWELQTVSIPKSELNVVRAESLQPFGYPLFDPVKLPKPKIKLKAGKTVSVFAQDNYAGEFHKKIILEAANKIGLKIKWVAVEPTKFYEGFQNNTEFDFLLINFGVADPEPTTWDGADI